MIVAFLHPGEMGASVAAACSAPGIWLSAGRSAETARRASLAGLEDAGNLHALAARADVVVSICPPGSAVDVAEEVAEIGFDGIFVDMNAISPASARAIASLFPRFVDGGIVGPPVRRPETTRLYLSGHEAAQVAELWRGSALAVGVLDGGAGAASALKGCYAGWTKISAALLLTVRAAAKAEGVEDALLAEWLGSQPDLAQGSERAAGNARKAWRFVGEMEEIANLLATNGLPPGFARAAGELYERLTPFKDVPGAALAEVIDVVRGIP